MKSGKQNSTNQFTQYTNAVVGFVVKDNKVLLGLRKKVSNDLGKNLYAGIGGKVESNESFDDALVREFREEVMISPTKFDEVGTVIFTWLGTSKWNLFTKVYKIDEYEGKIGETNPIKPEWFSIDRIPYKNMWKDNKYWIPQVLSGENFYLMFIYDENGEITEIIDLMGLNQI